MKASTPKTRPAGSAPAQKEVAASRERFLTRQVNAPLTVREAILASWRRSYELRVLPDKIEMSHETDVHLDTRLTRSALPVLRSLRDQLEGQSVSVILTDPTGLVLSRMTGDRELERHLDQVLLAPGFSYAEKYVGTNGIGTALEMGGPAHVFGHEHYAEHLEDLACAGVPIHHPISGRLVGAVDLTCWRKDAGALLLTLAKTTAEQIKQSLLMDAGSGELALFQEYVRTCGRTAGIVFALSKDLVMLNDFARSVLDPADQATLLAQAMQILVSGRRDTLSVELPSGQHARVYSRRVQGSGQTSGIVAHVRLGETVQHQARTRDAATWLPLPGMVGSGPPWLHACQEVERAVRAREWLAVAGEPGVGKLAVLRAAQLRRQPVGRLIVLDAEDAARDPDWVPFIRRAIAEDADSLVIRHLDALDDACIRSLASALGSARDTVPATSPWVAVTLRPTQLSKAHHQLLQLFPGSCDASVGRWGALKREHAVPCLGF